MTAQPQHPVRPRQQLPDALLQTVTYLAVIAPARALKWLLLRPVGILTLLAFVGMSTWIGAANIVGGFLWALIAAVPVLVLWRWKDRASYDKHAGWRLRSLARKHLVYKPRWKQAMTDSGLRKVLPGAPDRLPRLRSVVATRWQDRLLIDPRGQTLTDFRRAMPALAQAFNAPSCKVRKDSHRHNRLWLEIRTGDPLEQPLKPLPPTPRTSHGSLVVGKTETGNNWFLDLFGRHLLLAGETGSGKSSLIWAILWALAPFIRESTVQVWAIDPKGGMELGPGKALFARYACEDVQAMLALLRDAVAVMDARKASSEARGVRLHYATPEEPFIVVVVDEAAVLHMLSGDPKVTKEIERLLGLLLTQGRAPGVTLISALQVPTKSTLETRDLYPNRVMFRSMARTHADMVLGPGARERGAETDMLDQPGKAYVMVDGMEEPMIVRAFNVTDEDIRMLGSEWGVSS